MLLNILHLLEITFLFQRWTQSPTRGWETVLLQLWLCGSKQQWTLCATRRNIRGTHLIRLRAAYRSRHIPEICHKTGLIQESSFPKVIESSKRWWKCRNRFDQIGFVPFNILEPLSALNSPVGDSSLVHRESKVQYRHCTQAHKALWLIVSVFQTSHTLWLFVSQHWHFFSCTYSSKTEDSHFPSDKVLLIRASKPCWDQSCYKPTATTEHDFTIYINAGRRQWPR